MADVIYSPLDADRAQKAQWIRLLDVVLIGPLMSYGGAHLFRREPVLGAALTFLGASTIIYNGRNYLQVREALRQREAQQEQVAPVVETAQAAVDALQDLTV